MLDFVFLLFSKGPFNLTFHYQQQFDFLVSPFCLIRPSMMAVGRNVPTHCRVQTDEGESVISLPGIPVNSKKLWVINLNLLPR